MEKRRNETDFIEQLLSIVTPVEDSQNARAARRFIDELPGGFFIYRADDGRLLYSNRALWRLFRCETEKQFIALTDNNFRKLVHADDLAAVEESINRQIAESQDELDYVEYRIVCRDNTVRWLEDYGHFVHSEKAGDVFYVFVSDATDKINHRLALVNDKREKEERLQNLIEEYDRERKLIRQDYLQKLEVIQGLSVNYDSILYVDLDGDKVLPYRLSSRLEKQFDDLSHERPFKTFLREYVSMWVHPEDRKRVAERTSPSYMRKQLSLSPTYYLNFRCVQNGETQYLQLRMVNVGNRDRADKIVMGYRNVDEEIMQEIKQKLLLEEALHTAKSADIAKTAFLSNMSHDMRTPLNALFGFTRLARTNASDADAVRAYLDRIDEAGRQMLELVDQVLQLSYVESQRETLADTPCALSEILRDVCDAATPTAQKKNIRISVENAVAHDGIVCDRDKLIKLLGHLVANAVKYTPSGGNVTVSAAEQTATGDALATYRLTVKDTGVGIAPDAIKRIFEPFERVHNTTLSGQFGAGLGLTIAKRLAESMNGRIDVESQVGKGSAFTVTIPLRQSDATNATEIQKTFSPVGKKILLVEDNEINREIETDILLDLGFAVDTAENGRIAVDKVRNNRAGEYDCILMDIQMPVMDGRDATRAIRSLNDPRRAHIPIVALSANAFESDKRASIACGMDDHLPKPLDVDVLMQALTRIMPDA